MTVDPGDSTLDDDQVAQLSWYHTSTHPDWPTRDFDPAALLTAETRMRMGGELRVADWAARQRARALHLGTYEAAVQNMLRRMDDQDDHGSQFYLYRVQLKPSVISTITRIPAGSPWRLGGTPSPGSSRLPCPSPTPGRPTGSAMPSGLSRTPLTPLHQRSTD